jgi:Plasmid pRiA4b ORF-3-like protein
MTRVTKRRKQTNRQKQRTTQTHKNTDHEAAAIAELRQKLATMEAPAELLQALDGLGDPQEILDLLMRQSLGNLLVTFKPLLKRGTSPLDAELVGTDFLSAMAVNLSQMEDAPQAEYMVADLVAQAEAAGKPEGLAMLRVLAAIGPQQTRPAAAEAADRLVSSGLKELAWAKDLGAPTVGPCFGWGDASVGQEAIAITFSYGRKRHAIAVLIDHDLGGGVKDCYPTEQVDRIYAGFRKAASQVGLDLREYEPVEAHAILQQALSQQPCPGTADQVECIHRYLDLLRQRVGLLASADTTTPKSPEPPARAAEVTVHRMKVTLRGSQPPIWRRLEVPSTFSLEKLHYVIQDAFGWEEAHMWVFDTSMGRYGVTDRELGHRSAAAKKLGDVAPRKDSQLRYTYDFGDDWEHDIVVEDVVPAEPGTAYPRCVAGRRAGPPEDCGGIWGYQQLLETLADPGDTEHEELLDWLGLDSAEEFDPASFDPDATNKVLSAQARVLVRDG